MNAKTVPLSGSESRTSYLARLLDVLDVAVTHDRAPLQLGEIAAAAGVPPSTASRLVALLVERGFLVQLDRSGYAAGPRLLHLSVRTLDQMHAADRLKASVEALAEQTGESASAGLLVGDEIVLVARKEPEHSLRAVARVGDVLNPHTSAMGKAVLAMLPARRRLAVLRTAVGDRAEQALREAEAELATARTEGFAVDEESYAVGLRCRAAAILDRSGHAVGGISVAGPAARFTRENANACVPALLAEVKRLSLEIRSNH
ncbi:IclR family transcriptional regulator [Nonomuraea sp. KC401]|uniref:IclR family transcriptional regulator n=1 Tax=unclassified Nonomuraea TaxID=2593643 RepID=UPI0010FD2829|nr:MULTISPECIES: IclR family transcriptional regulator [unclassified Nonomuraea]NBE92287.1 helix-turn-helix domain-containing protein [Nonomuraea sp. K271]TLF77195.1 IclR family transcriptional regulator [Nonomuraea sp. KC401]